MMDPTRDVYLGGINRDDGRSRTIIGLGFGDEGKGMAVAHETARAVVSGSRVANVRFNGGPQAGHNVRVMLRDGTVLHHVHSQFGSGTLLGASTIITNGMLIDPIALVNEATHLAKLTGRDVMSALTIDERCPVVMPMHAIANRMLERARGNNRHGSTGRGIGVARTCEAAVRDGEVSASMMVDVDALLHPSTLLAKMRFWRSWIGERFGVELPDVLPSEADVLSNHMGMIATFAKVGSSLSAYRNMVDGGVSVVFEGSQGILLDERYGFPPHVTYGDMSASNARAIDPHTKVIGVTRTYLTRHGAGPMPNEDDVGIAELDNETNEWAGSFRTGRLDIPTLRRSANVAGVDEVAVSWLDSGLFDQQEAVDIVSGACDAPVRVGGYGRMVHEWVDL